MSDRPNMHPESLMMSYGYRPELSEGAIKCPVFQTSTYVFRTAEEGKAFFEVAYGLREKGADEEMGLIYSRINHPGLEILQDRLTLWDAAESAAVFESGMAAITTTFLEFLRPGDVLLHSEQLYGGTDHFIRHVLPTFNIKAIPFPASATEEELMAIVEREGAGLAYVDGAEEGFGAEGAAAHGGARTSRSPVKMIYVETPANPTNTLVDIEMCVSVAKKLGGNNKERPIVAVDNTFLGPIWQHPLKLGADLVLYSATKYLGGHSDLIAGACLGSNELITRVKTMRTFLGTMAGPWTSWLLLRSLETLKLRMEQQLLNTKKVVEFLESHPAVISICYPGYESPKSKATARDMEVYARQCLAQGAMISFEVAGGEAEAFKVLNSLKMIKLAVSLGGTESLAEHPATMTHADVPLELKSRIGVTPGLVRLSVGVEHYSDIIEDLKSALGSI